MNWRHETWRRLYVREQGSFAALSYSARALAAMLLKHVDDKGRFVARRGEGLADAIACRVGASRGERRQIRAATVELLEDGYLVVEGAGVRIRNFHRACGDVDPAATEPLPAPTEHRPSIEAAPTETRTCIEPDSTVSRPCTEECVNDRESLGSPSVVPSFLPEDPDPERVHAIPEAGAWPEPKPEPVRFNHGVARPRPRAHPPPSPRQLQLVPAAERLCDFHVGGSNVGRPAIPPRQACAQCRQVGARQVGARASPRTATTPSSAGEILGEGGWPPREPAAPRGP